MDDVALHGHLIRAPGGPAAAEHAGAVLDLDALDRNLGHSIAVFVGIDGSNLQNAIAVADGELQFIGDVDKSEASMRRVMQRIASSHGGRTSTMRRARPAMGCTASSRRWATPVRWSRRR